MRERNGDTTASRRDYLKAAGAVGATGLAGLAGCTGGDGSTTGTLATTVKDAPGDISDFETCVVTIEGIWLKAGEGDGETTTEADDAGTESDGGTETVEEQDPEDVEESDAREYHEFDEPQTADLVQLQDGDSALVDDREVETGSYEFLQLDVSGVDATLSDGGDADVDTPGNAPLQFKEPFEIREGQRTNFVADFTPVKRGQTGKYLLQPVASGTEVTYEDVTTSE
ncbi:DUF4382 domain-containing protein [Halobacterium sp. CBA1126]|uniref:DUF4382 domain-containing protein n=1 Tax=Halobacterium TaxID=2239 RepID=UPI0012FBCD53|nr:DUF4382 domain-containing protein [Halobacterium sp. CBA1126]MUV61233.1 DUF4382 domain-containing protein [Halobacterium sp. CBA1126]